MGGQKKPAGQMVKSMRRNWLLEVSDTKTEVTDPLLVAAIEHGPL